jgi:hypothetical protein
MENIVARAKRSQAIQSARDALGMTGIIGDERGLNQDTEKGD